MAPAGPGAGRSCDLTAHVLMESLLDEGDLLLGQRDALAALGIGATPPRYRDDAAGYLAALSHAGEVAELTDPKGLGGFRWLLHDVSGRSAPSSARRS